MKIFKLSNSVLLPIAAALVSCNGGNELVIPGKTESLPYKVCEYTPAPGQFIGDISAGGFSGESTAEEAAAYAEKRLAAGRFVSLGGFGGYIVVGFDESITSSGGYDFSITGNQYKGSSEPGIVWVMQDTNGNGLPDDAWYELRGSEYGKDETLRDYAVTYYRPAESGTDVQWTDNLGGSGTIDYLPEFHSQESYYPAWVKEGSYTLSGTCLKHHTSHEAGGKWVNGDFEWGYADNVGSDMISTGGIPKSRFRISDAVKPDGTDAGLQYIDFIKVQTGVNMKAGWTGEVSTEVSGFEYGNM